MPDQSNADTPDLDMSGVVGAFVTTPDGGVELRAEPDAVDGATVTWNPVDLVTVTWNDRGVFKVELDSGHA